MKSAFQKISRVSSLTGGTKWYLSKDCLLAAKRTMYVVEYRRFYLRDLDSIVVWPSRLWVWRLIIPSVLLLTLSLWLWLKVDSTAGGIFAALALAWAALEWALGPTAGSCIRTMGASVELSLVQRTRRAEKVLAKIDVAVRTARHVVEQSSPPIRTAQPAEPALQTRSEPSATTSIAAEIQTNGS